MNAAMWLAWLGMAGFVGLYGWAWQKAGEKGRVWLEWGLVMLVAGVSLASVLTHEPWRDETHAWLLSREMGVGALWKEMACEGHFLPWFLLLWPFAHSGAPVWTMGVVSWGLNAVAVWWLARRSPLAGWEKAAAGVSCLFLYVNPAVSRCYVLGPLALFGVASLWKKRDARPVAFGLWVALLANTHLYLEGMAAAVFVAYAWENVLHREDGTGWRKCRRQWAGLGVMAAGGTLALLQVLPSLWKSVVVEGGGMNVLEGTACLFGECVPQIGLVLAVAGLAGLGAVLWQADRGVFGVYAAGLAYMWFFSAFLYPADVLNRSLLWWPVALCAAWMAAGSLEGRGGWRIPAVVAAGLALARPDLTWADWREAYDPLPVVCRWIAGRYGADAEVWINGDDLSTEPAAVYLENIRDWRTGKRTVPISWGTRTYVQPAFADCVDAAFRFQPEVDSFLVMGSLAEFRFSGLEPEDFRRPGVEIEGVWTRVACPYATGIAVMRVWRRGRDWGALGAVRYQQGDREGAVAAWTRAAEEDDGQWAAMNNLAWVLLEEGRVAEAREWIDRALVHEAARASTGVRGTEEAIRHVEREGAGARGAERRMDESRNAECTVE